MRFNLTDVGPGALAMRGVMKLSLLHERYPIYGLELPRDESRFDSVDAICAYFRACIEAHPSAVFIAEFDHLAHTRSLPDGEVGEGIYAAKNLVFCFGIALPCPQILAVRPRSIGIAETDAGFLITFMEAPMPVANAAMEDWATGLRRLDTTTTGRLSPSADVPTLDEAPCP
jgi:hypothetical protein